MTTYFCQNSSSNVNDANNWDTNPAGGGTVLTWPPLAGDVLVANGKTNILVNVDIATAGGTAIGSITTAATGGTAGGGFNVDLSAARAIKASIDAGTTPCVTIITSHANRLTVTGNVTGGSAAGAYGITSGSRNLTVDITGNVTGGTNASAYGLHSVQTAGNPTITGNVTGATAVAVYLNTTTTDTLTVTGTVTSSALTAAIAFPSGGIVVLNGSIAGLATWIFPITGGSAFKLKWTGTDGSDKFVTLYDAAGTPASHKMYVPEYPAEGLVTDGGTPGSVTYDYGAMEGTRVDCPVAQAERTGTPYYGNPASLVDGTLYGPNLDSAPGVVDADAVISTAHFGVANATQGTAAGGGGGYTYGSENQAHVLTIATGAGTFDATNLSVGNVIQDVTFGVGLTGTGANLLATHTTYLSLEAGRNSKTAGAGQILSTYSVTIAGVTTNGLAVAEHHLTGEVIESAGGMYHEATTGEVKDGVTFGASSGLTGTYSPGGTFAEGQASIIAALVLPATDLVDAPEPYGVNLAGFEAYYLEGTGLNATTVAAAILATPANKLVTDATGKVTYANTAPPTTGDILTALGTGAWITAIGDTRIANLDATVSSRQATVANLANAVTMAAQFGTMVVLDGAVYDFTAAALAAAPSGTGLSAQETRDAMKLAPTAGAAAAGSLDAEMDYLQQLATAQNVLDQTATPWQLVVKDRTTGVELLRFDLKDSAGADVNSIEDFVAEMTTP